MVMNPSRRRPSRLSAQKSPEIQPSDIPAGILPSGVMAQDALAALSAERARIKTLSRLHKMCADAEVAGFDFDSAVQGGVSAAAAITIVQDLLASADEGARVYNRSTTATIAEANRRDGWDSSLKRVAARQGISLRQEGGR